MGKKRIIKKDIDEEGKEGFEEGKKAAPPTREVSLSAKTSRGVAHIQATYNNTIIMITDEGGNAIAWSTAGALGFSGAKKATPFAAARVAQTVAEKVKKAGVETVTVLVSGVGSGRDSAIRALANQGLSIISIRDITPLPHNGPRPKKVRRV